MGDQPDQKQRSASNVLRAFERAVLLTLIAMMMVVVALSVVELGWILVRDVTSPPVLILEVDELLELFGLFLLVLIGIEILETMKAYLRDNVVHMDIVLEVALIALARKVIVLDFSKYPGVTVLGLAALIAALAGTYFLQRRRRRSG